MFSNAAVRDLPAASVTGIEMDKIRCGIIAYPALMILQSEFLQDFGGKLPGP